MNNKKNIAISIGIMCFILTVAISIQLKTVKANVINISGTLSESGLRDEVLKWKEKYEQMYSQVQYKEKELDNERKKAIKNDENAEETQGKLENLHRLIGYTDLNGPGIIIILDDNKTTPYEEMIDPSNFIVHDTDIMLIVNELKAGGAEAISINGQRLVSRSRITCVGPTIMVNNQKLAAPYEIKAIGHSEGLESVINYSTGLGDQLRSYGLKVDVQKQDNVTIYKYSGLIESKYLTIVD